MLLPSYRYDTRCGKFQALETKSGNPSVCLPQQRRSPPGCGAHYSIFDLSTKTSSEAPRERTGRRERMGYVSVHVIRAVSCRTDRCSSLARKTHVLSM